MVSKVLCVIEIDITAENKVVILFILFKTNSGTLFKTYPHSHLKH